MLKRLSILIFVAYIIFAGCKKNDTAPSSSPAETSTPIMYTPMEAAAVYNGNLVVGGYAGGTGKINSGIGQWNGSSWASLGNGLQAPCIIFALCTFNGKLIAAGSFYSIGGIKANNIAQWDGTSWSALGNGLTYSSAPSEANVFALMVYKGNLIATGVFDSANGVKVNEIAQWNGSSWAALGNGLGYHGVGSGLISYNGNLIVTGSFDSTGKLGGIYDIGEWNGASWDSVPFTYSFPSSDQSWGGVVYNNNLVVRSYGPVEEWNGNQWIMIGNDSSLYAPMFCNNSAIVYNGSLCVTYGGSVQAWNGTLWNTIGTFSLAQSGSGLSHVYSNTIGFIIYNGNLVAYGLFDPDNVAMYNGATWTSL